MVVDLFAVAFFAGWTCLLWSACRRVGVALRAATEFRASALLLETRRNG